MVWSFSWTKAKFYGNQKHLNQNHRIRIQSSNERAQFLQILLSLIHVFISNFVCKLIKKQKSLRNLKPKKRKERESNYLRRVPEEKGFMIGCSKSLDLWPTAGNFRKNLNKKKLAAQQNSAAEIVQNRYRSSDELINTRDENETEDFWISMDDAPFFYSQSS